MGRTGRTIAAAAAVLLAAGCAANGGTGPAGSGHQAKTLASARTGSAGPPTITRPRGEALARALLAKAPLPGGARPSSGRPPAVLAHPSSAEMGRPSAELHRLWTAVGPMSSVYQFWNGRAPSGMVWNGGGQVSGHGSVTQESVEYALKRLPAGVAAATVTMAVAPTGKDALVIRADVQVIWYPPRSAAEYIPPGTRAVTITASALNPSPHTVTKTITSRPAVRRLAAMLNGAYAMPAGAVFSCPAEMVSYRLAFAKAPGAAPFLVATDTGCPGVQMTVGGGGQPALETPAPLQPLLENLTHVSVSSGASPGGPVHTLPK